MRFFIAFKCANFIGQKNPLRVTIIDFDYASALISGEKTLNNYGYTPGIQAPEVAQGKAPTERSLVFEFGLVLFHFLTVHRDDGRKDSRLSLVQALRILDGLKARDLGRQLATCLHREPSRRPKNYEDLWRRIRADRLPANIEGVWRQLRAPYADRLTQVGL